MWHIWDSVKKPETMTDWKMMNCFLKNPRTSESILIEGYTGEFQKKTCRRTCEFHAHNMS